MKLSGRDRGGVLVITEGVFGMPGTLGALDRIADLRRRYGFRLLVDDAHGFGVLGPRGAGAGAAAGVQDDIDLYFATFAKAAASIGAFVTGSAAVLGSSPSGHIPPRADSDPAPIPYRAVVDLRSL